MFNNNDNPDYYNDAIRDARVNSGNIENNNSNFKGKLLLISNLFLISAILGYFIYQNMNTKEKKAVMGVNYTVDIHEEKSSNSAINNKIITEDIPKEEISTDLKKIINNSNKNNSPYIEKLDNELTKKEEDKHQNRELENILADIDTKGFSETTNVVKIDNEPAIEKDVDLDELANLVNDLVLEEQLKSSPYEKQLTK